MVQTNFQRYEKKQFFCLFFRLNLFFMADEEKKVVFVWSGYDKPVFLLS